MSKHPLDGFEDDIRDHLNRETCENIERGMTPDAARRAALRKFGNIARVMEETRDVWRRVWLEQLLQDVRYSLRFLRRNPRFSAVVVLTLAIGIGVNTAFFSVVNTVLLKPVTYPDAGRLVWIGAYDPRIGRDFVWKDDYFDWRKQARSFALLGVFGYQQAVVATPRGVSQSTGVYVDGDFWRIVGAQPAAGRRFGQEQDCVVLTWDFFQREFAADAAVVGQAVVLNSRPVRIAGVLPRSFRFQFPMWWAALHPDPVEVYLTVPRPGEAMAQSTQVVATLKPGVSVAQAAGELHSLEAHLIEARGGQDHGMTNLRVDPLAEQLGGNSRRALLVLLAAGAFVLLIAIVNVANLLLARATLRQKEVAIRAAVGAGRSRVLRQLLAESALQAVAGGAAGLLLARGAIFLLVRISPNAVPRLSETAIDARVLAFTLAVSLLAGVLFGAAPAIALRRSNLHDSLKSGMRNSAGPGGLRLRRALVAVELALAIVLLTGAGLMLKSYARMNAHAPGFDPGNIIVMKVRFVQREADAPAQRAYVRELVRRIESAPGTRAAGVSCWIFGRGLDFPFHINAASPGYLQALGMQLEKGRWLTEADTHGALLNESMARQAFGTVDPIGRQLAIPRPVTIVGVVANVKYSKLDAEAPPELFLGIGQAPDLYGVEIAARAAARPAAVVPLLRQLVAGVDPSQRVYDVETLDRALAQSIAPRRFNLFLLGGFAAAAFLLAVVGIYGVAAYSVAERTREIGLRMAMGARRGQMAVMVVREALPVALAGIAAGLAAAWGLSRIIESLLYQVSGSDPQTFVLVSLVLASTALAACIGPALKAASVDPTVALRYE
jgi:putative ABC transport system permease protein